MNWLLGRLVRYLLGPAALDGITDERLDGLTLAMDEEFALLMAQDA